MKIATSLFAFLALCGCAEPKTEDNSGYIALDVPFSATEGAQGIQPYLLGWQCDGNFGDLVQQLNGYKMFISPERISVDRFVMARVSVQPPEWPCAFSAYSRILDGNGETIQMSELAKSIEFYGGTYMTSKYRPLSFQLQSELIACISADATRPGQCADEILEQYTGQGVSFAYDFPHQTRDDTYYDLGVGMIDGKISFDFR